MTRINVLPVEELCDKHLLAEFREMTRIPNTINSGKAKVVKSKIPKQYTLGKGHVTFFYDKLKWLHNRYQELYKEGLYRGFNLNSIWPKTVPIELYNDYQITPEAISTNKERIALRMPNNARWTKRSEQCYI